MLISFNSSIFLLFTEPPYKTFGVFLANLLLIYEIEFVKSFDVDDLQEVVSRNQEFRQKIAKEAESLVEEERIIFLEWWASLEAVPVINKLRSDLELIRKEELQKALSRMGPDFSARERKVVEALTKGIINKILHTPVTKLRSPQSREERQVSLKIVEKLFSLVEEDKNN